MDTERYSKCHVCENTSLTYRWFECENGTRHIRVDCPECKRFLGYAPQLQIFVNLADKNPDVLISNKKTRAQKQEEPVAHLEKLDLFA
jgi:hypothetical protein